MAKSWGLLLACRRTSARYARLPTGGITQECAGSPPEHMAASCSLGSEPVPTTSTTYPAPVAQATAQPGPELARIISSLAAAGDPCEHVDVQPVRPGARGCR